MIAVDLQCPRHPRYEGKKAPKAKCTVCKFIWQLLNIEKKAPIELPLIPVAVAENMGISRIAF